MSSPASNEATDTASLAATLIAENKRPTEAQELQIREALPRLQEDVRKLQKEFNDVDISLAIISPNAKPDVRLQEELAHLSIRLSNAKDKLSIHMNCIAYGRQLPVEVLEVVFQRCLPQDDYIRPNRSQAPLLLCQICSSWRRVALVTPRLWCSLSIELSRRPGAWKAFLDSWLGRSGKTPISLSFTRHQNTYYGYFNDHILKILLRDSKRWRSLRLDVPATTLTKLLNTSMPLLETFEIKSPGTFPGVFITAADAPNLRSVSVLDAETRAADMHVPWDRLTQFHASKHIVDLEKCFVLLARCKNLARCSIRLSTGGGQLPQHLLPLRMPRLHTLLLLADEDAVNSFFTKVELPRLESLALMHVRDETFELGAQSPLVLLTNLRSLCLGGGATEGLLEMVIAIPSLKDVYLGKETGKYKVLPKAVQKIVDMRRSAKETPREVLF